MGDIHTCPTARFKGGWGLFFVEKLSTHSPYNFSRVACPLLVMDSNDAHPLNIQRYSS